MSGDKPKRPLGPELVVLGEAGPPRPADKYDAPMLMAQKGQRYFHVVAKPIGSACNLNCAYCFYLHKQNLPDGPRAARMPDNVLERFVQQYIGGVTAPEVVFTWQGGEPTLLGLDFFRNVVALQRKHARPGQRIHNDLQTNGTLLDEDWCKFLKAHEFLVGLSIDGPKELHDRYRVTRGGEPTFERVMNAVRLLHRHKIPFNTLTCVHAGNVKHPIPVYRFLRSDVRSTHIQFTPVVEHRTFETSAPRTWDASKMPKEDEPAALPGHADSVVTEWSVDPDDWGAFLCKVFDRWRAHDVGKILVSQFETLVSQHLGLGSQLCIYNEMCGKAVAVENDGSIYSCDHYVYPEYRLGNIGDSQLVNQVLSRWQVKFGYAKSESLPAYCLGCPYLTDCWGECPKNRFIRTPGGDPGLNYLCRGYKKFFQRVIPEIERIVAGLRQSRSGPQAR